MLAVAKDALASCRCRCQAAKARIAVRDGRELSYITAAGSARSWPGIDVDERPVQGRGYTSVTSMKSRVSLGTWWQNPPEYRQPAPVILQSSRRGCVPHMLYIAGRRGLSEHGYSPD